LFTLARQCLRLHRSLSVASLACLELAPHTFAPNFFYFLKPAKKIDLFNFTFFNEGKLEADNDEFVIRGTAWGCQPQLHPSTQVAPPELVRHQHARLSVSSSITSKTANLLSAELTSTLWG
jgi:hypothetical protein